MPAGARRRRACSARGRRRFLRRRGRRRVARIEADGDDLEIRAGHRATARSSALARPLIDLRAQHRAVVIGEHHHDRAACRSSRRAAPSRPPRRGTVRVERHALVDVLIEADLAQRRRHGRRRHARLPLEAGARRRAGHLGVQRRRARKRTTTEDTERRRTRHSAAVSAVFSCRVIAVRHRAAVRRAAARARASASSPPRSGSGRRRRSCRPSRTTSSTSSSLRAQIGAGPRAGWSGAAAPAARGRPAPASGYSPSTVRASRRVEVAEQHRRSANVTTTVDDDQADAEAEDRADVDVARLVMTSRLARRSTVGVAVVHRSSAMPSEPSSAARRAR